MSLIGAKEGIEGMGRTIGIPEGEGAVGLVLRLVDRTIRP